MNPSKSKIVNLFLFQYQSDQASLNVDYYIHFNQLKYSSHIPMNQIFFILSKFILITVMYHFFTLMFLYLFQM